MLPLVALVGRPNVGKSTIFNALTRSRDALLMQGIAPHGFPDAVIRTPDAVYLAEILPS